MFYSSFMKNLLKFFCLISSACFLLACAGTSDLGNEALESSQDSIIHVRKTITVSAGDVFDGKNALYEWTGAGDCSQTEGMPPMFRLMAGARLQNLRMKNAPDGIHVRGSNVTITNIVNLDVCEDAISIKLDKNKKIPRDVTISHSKFYDCEDKAIQVTNNEFHNCSKALRVQKQAQNIRFENNRIHNAKVAVKVSGGELIAGGNLFDTAKVAYWIEKAGVMIQGQNDGMKRVLEAKRLTEGGVVVTE